MSCIFCQIAARKIPANIVYEDREIIAFDDIAPAAKCHKLIIPKKHIPTFNDWSLDDVKLISNLLLVAQKIAKDLNIAESGYRIVNNCNRDGGQIIYHLHFHLLGGELLKNA